MLRTADAADLGRVLVALARAEAVRSGLRGRLIAAPCSRSSGAFLLELLLRPVRALLHDRNDFAAKMAFGGRSACAAFSRHRVAKSINYKKIRKQGTQVAFQQKLNIANFICKFGDNLVLLDLAAQVVIPAFKGGLKRTFADSSYFFHNVEIIDLSTGNNPEIALVGRLVKETKVSREQVFKDGKIVPDHQELESAPTSFFVLLLSNHKLMYVRENSGSPLIGTFSSTIEQFIRRTHRTWIDSLYESAKLSDEKVTKKKLFETYPIPTVDIVELSTETEIEKFVKKFRTINSVEIQLVNTNHELDNSALFGDLRAVKDQVEADRLTVKTEKSGETGLNKTKVAQLISTPAEEGNSRITLKGRDLAGERMDAKNDHFKLSIPITEVSKNNIKATNYVTGILHSHLNSGIISFKAVSKVALEKLQAVRLELGL